MIFKTFDSDIDKIGSKWGMFGHSFNDIGTAIVGRITDINKAFQATDDLSGSIKASDSIWKRLYPSKESINAQLIDVDSLIPEIDKKSFNFDFWINRLNTVDKKVKSGTRSWQDFSNSLANNQKWIAKWGQETEGQIRTESDLVKANQQARDSAKSDKVTAFNSDKLINMLYKFPYKSEFLSVSLLRNKLISSRDKIDLVVLRLIGNSPLNRYLIKQF